MAKRQIRVTKEPDQLLHEKNYLNFVLTNNTVFLGKVLSVQSGSVKIKNSKGHVLHLPLDRIEEIWSEEKVAK